MSDLNTYVDSYRAAHDRNDVEEMDQLLLGVPDALLPSFHRAVQAFDPVTAPTIDPRRAREVLLADGADEGTADFLAAVASGDLPAFIAQVVPAGAERETAERLCRSLQLDATRQDLVAELSEYLVELAGRGDASILAADPAADLRATQQRRAWSLAERALDAIGDVLGMPAQVVARLRAATEYPAPMHAGGLARGDGELFDEAQGATPELRSEVGRIFDDLQPPPCD